MPSRPSSPPSRLRWWPVVLLGLGVTALVWLYVRSDFDLERLVETIAGWNALAVFVLIALLPVTGFSVAVTYLVAGIKFGPVLGGVAVAGATAVHLLLTYWISRTFLRAPLQRFLARRKHALPHVPEGENASVAAMAALVPGLPYFARNYLLALTDMPLRIYFWVCLPIYVARSYLVILVGDLGLDLNRRSLTILGVAYGVKLAICGWLLWRIRRRIKRAHAAAAREGRSPAHGGGKEPRETRAGFARSAGIESAQPPDSRSG